MFSMFQPVDPSVPQRPHMSALITAVVLSALAAFHASGLVPFYVAAHLIYFGKVGNILSSETEFRSANDR